MQQVGRNLTITIGGFLRDTRHIILDRDPRYTAARRRRLADSGCKVVRTPARSPNSNAPARRALAPDRCGAASGSVGP
jgi:putative transposase